MFADYFNEIEAHFALRRGTPVRLSHLDVALAQEWFNEAIPLALVIEALDAVFDKANEREKVVNGLRYCRHAVKELWKERRQLQVGADAATPEAEVEETLGALASSLAERGLDAFASRVTELAAERSVPRIEERLIELEHELVTSLATADIREEAARAVGGALDEATRARTEEAYVRRLVREKYELPRLTLFR